MDAKSTFFNGSLKEEACVGQPPSYVVHGYEDRIYKLKKTLYGMKREPRAWYKRIEAYLKSNGFNRSSNKPTLNRN